MYKNKKAIWIKIIVLVSVLLCYIPLILLFNYLSEIDQLKAIFCDNISTGGSIFFPWLSSVKLLEFSPLRGPSFQFSMGNLLDIIIFCNLATYIDGLIYHFFVKRILPENEHISLLYINYYCYLQTDTRESNYELNLEHQLIHEISDNFSTHSKVEFLFHDSQYRFLKKYTKRKQKLFSTNLSNLHLYISLIFGKNNGPFLYYFPPLNYCISFHIIIVLIITHTSHNEKRVHLNAFVCFEPDFLKWNLTDEDGFWLILPFTSFLFLIYFIINNYKLPHVHTITSNFSKLRRKLENILLNCCDDLFLFNIVLIVLFRERIPFFKSDKKLNHINTNE